MFTVIWSRQGNPLRLKVFLGEKEARRFIEDMLKAEYLDIMLVQGEVVNSFKA